MRSHRRWEPCLVETLLFTMSIAGCKVTSEPEDSESQAARETPTTLCAAADSLAGRHVDLPVIEHPTGGIIEGEVTWRAVDGIHVVVANEVDPVLRIAGGARLVIEPCALVQVGPGAALVLSDADDKPAELIAHGEPARPILITGTMKTPGAWGGIALYGGSTAQLVATTVEYGTALPLGDSANAAHGAALLVAGRSLLTLTQSIVRFSSGSGVRLVQAGRFGSGTTGNVVTANGAHPIAADWIGDSSETDFDSVDQLPDGAYTGNTDDRVLLEGEEALVLRARTVTLSRLSVPYLVASNINDIGISVVVESGGQLVIEPGTEVEMAHGHGEPYGFATEIEVAHDGSLVLAGTESEPIVMRGVAGGPEPSWGGIGFRCDTNDAGVRQCPRNSIIRHVRLVNAGGMDLTSFGCMGTCNDDAGAWCTGPGRTQGGAILVSDDLKGALVIDHVTFENLGPHTYGVFRNYCGSGEPEYSSGNQFIGEYFCAETDQSPCEVGQADFVCDPALACCSHPFRCFGKE